MRVFNILFRLYFEESNAEGVQVLCAVSNRSQEVILKFPLEPDRSAGSRDTANRALADCFQLVEGTLVAESPPLIEIRYRPSLSSKTWANSSSVPNVLPGMSKKEHQQFQLLLSFKSFERAARAKGLLKTAVLELLCHSVPESITPEMTIYTCLQKTCPEILDQQLWGYADIVPFRQLSVKQEWEVARTDTFWSDLSETSMAQHQYLLLTPGGEPKVVIPASRVTHGRLALHKLPAQ